MRLEEAIPHLRSGKAIASNGHVFRSIAELADSTLSRHNLYSWDDWSIVEEPATDEELAAAFEARAREWDSSQALYTGATTGGLLRSCADMVRKRYVDPSWKVGK